MDSKREYKSGTVTTYASLETTPGQEMIKENSSTKLIIPPHELPKHPIVIKLEMGGGIPIAQFLQVKYNVGIELPIDISQISLREAFSEARSILYIEARTVIKEVTSGVFVQKFATAEPIIKDDE